MKQSIEVQACWDSKAKVWTATSDQVPGLAIESETIEALVERLREVIPELLELNQEYPVNDEIVFHLHSERSEVVKRH